MPRMPLPLEGECPLGESRESANHSRRQEGPCNRRHPEPPEETEGPGRRPGADLQPRGVPSAASLSGRPHSRRHQGSGVRAGQALGDEARQDAKSRLPSAGSPFGEGGGAEGKGEGR